MLPVKRQNLLFSATLSSTIEIPGIHFSENYIRHDQNLVNAMAQSKDIFSYKNSSNAAIDYRNLVDEFLESEE